MYIHVSYKGAAVLTSRHMQLHMSVDNFSTKLVEQTNMPRRIDVGQAKKLHRLGLFTFGFLTFGWVES